MPRRRSLLRRGTARAYVERAAPAAICNRSLQPSPIHKPGVALWPFRHPGASLPSAHQVPGTTPEIVSQANHDKPAATVSSVAKISFLPSHTVIHLTLKKGTKIFRCSHFPVNAHFHLEKRAALALIMEGAFFSRANQAPRQRGRLTQFFEK